MSNNSEMRYCEKTDCGEEFDINTEEKPMVEVTSGPWNMKRLFCSQSCREKYKEESNLDEEDFGQEGTYRQN